MLIAEIAHRQIARYFHDAINARFRAQLLIFRGNCTAQRYVNAIIQPHLVSPLQHGNARVVRIF